MHNIRIDVEEGGKPSATITIPLWLAKSAAALAAKAGAKDAISQIDFDEVLKAAQEPGANGTIVEVLDHKNGDKVSISIV